MIDLGRVRPGRTINIPFGSYTGSTGASSSASGFVAGDVQIYKATGGVASTTQRASSSGITATTDFDAVGENLVTIDLSDNTTAGFYASGSEYTVWVADVTIDGQTVRLPLARWTIGFTEAVLDTTIATLASQTSFTLTNGSADNNAYVGCPVYISPVASSIQCAMGVISAYVGATKTVTLAFDPAIYTMAATDNISIFMRQNAYAIGGQVQAAPGAANGLVINGANSGNITLGNVTTGAVTNASLAVTGNLTAGNVTVSTATNLGVLGAGNTTIGNLTVSGTSNLGVVAGNLSAVATAIWTDTNASDFIAISSIGKSLYTGGAVPGAAGGIFLAGSNAATTVASLTCTGTFTVSDGIVVTRSTPGASAVVVTGDGAGHGILATSGSGVTGDGIRAVSNATNGNGFSGLGTGTANGMILQGGAGTSGDGLHCVGGIGNGAGIRCLSGGASAPGFIAIGGTLAGEGMLITGTGDSAGLKVVGSGTGAGIEADGGSTNGPGAKIVAGGADGNGMEIVGDGTGAGVRISGSGAEVLLLANGATNDAITATGGIGGADIRGNLTGTINGLTTTAKTDVEDAVWDATLSSHLSGGSTGAALNAAGSAGDPWLTLLPGAYGPGTAGSIIGTGIPEIAPGAAGGLLIAGANADTTVNIIGNLSGSVGSVAAGGIVAASLDTAAMQAIADAFLDREMSAGVDSSNNSNFRTPRQSLQAIRDKWSIAGNVITYTKGDDATTTFTSTLGTDPAAVPIVSSDPAGP